MALLLVVAGCSADGQPNPAANSGVEGRTMVDGGCPTIGPDNPCPDVPLAAKITVTKDSDQTVVNTVQSGEDGRYRITLAPGAYTLHADNLTGSLLPRGTTVRVRIDQGQFQTVELKFDSGIRGIQTGG
ncbi:MAG TPA: carboxypeptidase-like regulatory domain-containing protein [Microlunatus sp.]|nr:carboxypeptidase-like regulatory domain-containing protein [Microlunatus sp.]